MKTLKEIHQEEQVEACWAEFRSDMLQIEADHIKRVKRNRRISNTCQGIVIGVTLAPLIGYAIRLMFK